MKYEPKFGRVLIKREIQEQSKGGIIIPESAAKRHAPCVGTIVALGETAGWTETYNTLDHVADSTIEHNRVVMQTLAVGDKVIFGRHSGAWLDGTYKDLDNNDGTLFICQDADILCVVREAA